MSVIKRIIQDSKQQLEVDELLAEEFESSGYGGITLTKTPLGAQINLFTMRPGRVIGKRGRSIKAASTKLEEEIGLNNPQITVVEIEVPELNPRIMASRIANALQRGVHYRRAIFWSLRRIMDSGALGCEILVKGPLRSSRGRYEKVSEGYIPKSGDPTEKYLRYATIHVKMKRGTVGVNITIVPPDAKFPDKTDLSGLPEIEYTQEQIEKYERFDETITEQDADEEILEDIENKDDDKEVEADLIPVEEVEFKEEVLEREEQTSVNEDLNITEDENETDSDNVEVDENSFLKDEEEN